MSGFSALWFFGVFVAFFGGTQFFMRRNRSFTQQGITVALAMPCADAYQLCINALPSVKAKLREGDSESGRIIAVTGMSWKTWGDVIEMEVTPINASQSSVKIVASQLIKSTIADWGQNRHLLRVLNRELLSGEESG